MNGIDYLADTNCFIYLLDEHPLLLSFANDKWAYSFITEMELLSKKGISAKEDKTVRHMLDTCLRFGHNPSITEGTITLRRKYSLKLPDAIIAATALHSQIPLLTADKHFAVVSEIDCILLEV